MVSNASTVDNDIEEVPENSGNTIDITASDEDDEICEVEHLRKLFIGGLSGETTDVSLRKFFSKWGNVVDSVVMRDPATKRSRGFGFVTYTKASMIDKAQASRPHIIDGKKVESKRALPRPEPSVAETKKSLSVKKLFVGGLKDEHDEECLKEYFSEFGKVVSVNILVDNTTGKRRGFAFIEYDDYDAVDKAILQKTHLIKYVLVDVRKSIYTQDPKKSPEKDAGRKQESKNQENRPDMRMRSGPYNNMQRNAYPRGYQNMNRPPVPPPPAPQPQQYQQMPPYQQVPPSNYKQWGPPTQYAQGPPQPPAPYAPTPPHPQQQYQQSMPPHNYGAYQQAPMPPAHTQAPPAHTQAPPPNWNSYAHPMGGNNWNAPAAQAAVPNPPPPPTWHNNNWGAPPPPAAGPPPPAPMPAANHPPPNWQQPPPPQNSGPPPPHQQPPAMYQPQQQQPPPPPPLPNNFGNGYQQNYGGGPTKHQNAYSNRMNPYNAQPNQYNNAPAQGYGNPMPNGSKYRR